MRGALILRRNIMVNNQNRACSTPLPESACKKCDAVSQKGIKNRVKLAMLIGILCLAALFFGFYSHSKNVLTGEDKIAYELVLQASDNFENPGSVRLVSGTLEEDEDLEGVPHYCILAGISSTNGFGKKTIRYYSIFEDGDIIKEKQPDSDYKSKDALNINKINDALGK
jgi:hypothetical protein